ncbi:MAG: transposase [Gammaproteobacteria bacterium]|nr:transposase [Gammaproteobacteria bacterium]
MVMARMARLVVPHYPHHVTQRGNRRQKVFFNDSDYALYRSWLAAACEEVGSQIWAYCLMPNHVHLILMPEREDGLRATLGETHRHYTRHINFQAPMARSFVAGAILFLCAGRAASIGGGPLRRTQSGCCRFVSGAVGLALVECQSSYAGGR